MNLGAGVAYRTESRQLNLIFKELSRYFQEHLIPQDRQGFLPHNTMMNKTTTEAAKQLLLELTNQFKPRQIIATGFDRWTYPEQTYRFA